MALGNSCIGPLFSLFPLNDRARELVHYVPNSHLKLLVSTTSITGQITDYGLTIGCQSHLKSARTLTTIGRDADILVPLLHDDPQACISRIQCSFELHEDSGEILLYDRSCFQNTQVDGPDTFPFQSERVPRRVLVNRTINTILRFGNPDASLFKFRIVWHSEPPRAALDLPSVPENPRMMRTQELRPKGPQTENSLHNHVQVEESHPLRYFEGDKVGSGLFGSVYKAVDVDSGRLLAVKKIVPEESEAQYIRREIDILKATSHPHILEFITAQANGPTIEIFTPIKDGSVDDLMDVGVLPAQKGTANSLLSQMLQALDYLSHFGIIHRDVKPANILHCNGPDFIFQLADFGLSNYASKARTIAGSPIWMAPEVMATKGAVQTPKADVWSLFVVIVEVLNVRGFHTKRELFQNDREILMTVQEARGDALMAPLTRMGEMDPAQRASAGDMLDALFSGKGRSSPRQTDVDTPMAGGDPMSAPPPVQQTGTKAISAKVEATKAYKPISKGKQAKAKATGAKFETRKAYKLVSKDQHPADEGVSRDRIGARRRKQAKDHNLLR